MRVKKLKYQHARNLIDSRTVNNQRWVRVWREEWEAIKSELERLGRVEDAVKLMNPDDYIVKNGMLGKK